jgi:hypothetical protein
VVFSSLTPDLCTITNTMVQFLTVGKCIIAANQPGGGQYAPAAQVTQSVKISK